jgi:uncharacterized membrane protein YjjP (DUF1212 family)
MTDNTRDIAIQVQSDLKHVADAVEALSRKVENLTEEMQQRKGAERLAKVLIGLGSGVSSAALVKLSSWIGVVPIR